MFLSILGITVMILLLQIAVLFGANYRMSLQWPEYVLSDYMESLKETFSEEGELKPDTLINQIIAISNDRVSGLLFRSDSGEYALMYGNAPSVGETGEKRTKRIKTEKVAMPISSDLLSLEDVLVSRKVHQYSIVMTRTSALSDEHEVFIRDDGMIAKDYLIPGILSKGDTAGWVNVYQDEVLKGSFDVLVYGMHSYGPTKFMLHAMLLVFLLFMPLALVISGAMSYRISHRSAKETSDIQNALAHLAHNEFDVHIRSPRTEELCLIASSIEKLSSDLKEHQKMRQEWFRSISHDLNTPLSGLSLLLEGAQDGMFPLDQVLVSKLKGECDSLSERVGAVSYYAHLLSPDAKCNRSNVSVRSFITSAVGGFEPLCLLFDFPDDFVMLMDERLGSRAVEELLKNAQQNNTSSSPLSVTVKKEGQSAIIQVANKGHLPSPLPDFFEPWARGDQSRHEGGSGLGLPIIGQIMRLSDGKAEIHQEGDEVIASLFFPLAKE